MKMIYRYVSIIMLGLALIVISNSAFAAERSERDFIGASYDGIVVNCNEWITLRYAPSADSPSLTKIPLGTIVTVPDGDVAGIDGFYPVVFKGLKGYCMKEYLNP